MSQDELISLEEAAKTIPSATAETLKRKARAGKLRVYRIGKAYSTTLADIEEMIAACRVEPKVRGFGSAKSNMTVPVSSPTTAPGLSSTEHAKSRLAAALNRRTDPDRKR